MKLRTTLLIVILFGACIASYLAGASRLPAFAQADERTVSTAPDKADPEKKRPLRHQVRRYAARYP